MNETVACLICQKTMKTINNKHLALHSITAEEYKERFPGSSLLSEASAHKLSERSIKSNASRKGIARTDEEKLAMSAGQQKYFETHGAHNKGIVASEIQKQKQSETMKLKFQSGDYIHPNKGKHHSEETKQKISEKLIGIPQGSERAYKAIETKINKGYDLAFFRGHKHSNETKILIGQKSTIYYSTMSSVMREPMRGRINESNLTLLNDISDETFKLRCNICNYEFSRNHQMFVPSKHHLKICDQCFPISKTSQPEIDIKELIGQWLPNQPIIGSDMEQISPLELDIYLPELKIAIEYCGLYWHSELAGKYRWYHRHKFDACKKKGIKLITIFEDEWLNHRDIIESMLRNGFKLNTKKINARDCKIIEIATETTSPFLDENHIQGHGRSNVKYGLLYQDELLSVMTFSDNEISRKSIGWDINRFATKFNTNIRGGASKLFSKFLHDYNPKKVTSLADLRYGEGNVYSNLGFTLIDYTHPGYWYFRPNEMKRYHRFALRKTLNDPLDKTEWEARQEQGWNRIWDCGHAKWEWNNE
jgi:Zn finger protein HypA/HybF involved in hydrogenase expression